MRQKKKKKRRKGENVPTICFCLSVSVHQIKLGELLVSLAEVVQVLVIKERLKFQENRYNVATVVKINEYKEMQM